MKRLHEEILRMLHPRDLASYDLKREAVLDKDKIAQNEKLSLIFDDPYKKLAYHEYSPELTDHRENLCSIKNWLRYRICTKLDLYTVHPFDCDTTDLVKDWFKEILLLSGYTVESIKGRVFKLSNGIFLETDTLTSFAIPFNNFIRHCLIDLKFDPDYIANYKKLFQLDNTSEPYRDLYFLIHLDEWYDKLKDDKNYAKACNILNDFAYETHTIGNISLVPHRYNTARPSELWDESLRDLQTKMTKPQDDNLIWYAKNYHLFGYDEFFTDLCTKDNFIKNTVRDECQAVEAFIPNNNDVLEIIDEYFWIIVMRIIIRSQNLYDIICSKFIFDEKNMSIIVESGTSLKKFNSLVGTDIPTKDQRNITYSKDEKVALFIRRYTKYFISLEPQKLGEFESLTGLTICHSLHDYTDKVTISSKGISSKMPRDAKEKKYDITVTEFCDKLDLEDRCIKCTEIVYKGV